MIITIAVGAAFVVSVSSPLLVKPLLRRLGVMDVPNSRSSHSTVVVRGLGLSVLFSFLVGGSVFAFGSGKLTSGATFYAVVFACSLAGALGLVEDVRGLAVKARALAQLLISAVAVIALVVLEPSTNWWMAPVFTVAIAGYINVANFMDGVNLISAFHGMLVGAVFALTGAIANMPWMTAAGAILAASFAGFVFWNARGRAFLGDVGSYLLGGGVAAISVAGVTSGLSWLAMAAPLAIYLADAGFTLVRRVARGERWYEAHRSHVYQRLNDQGCSHVQVAAIVAGASGLTSLIGLAHLVGTVSGLSATLMIALVVIGYLLLPRRASRRLADTGSDSGRSVHVQNTAVSSSNERPFRWVIVGGTGFIGGALVADLLGRNQLVRSVRAPRLELEPGTSPEKTLETALALPELADFSAELTGADIVVNAAGLATPDSNSEDALYGANSLLPAMIATSARQAGVTRFVHLSSAAVQGRSKVLDESTTVHPFSAYSRSKAAGEQTLLAFIEETKKRPGPEIVILRATSVQGSGRETSRRLQRFAQSPIASVALPGSNPSVVSSLKGLTRFIAAVGTFSGSIPPIVLQPWEGLSTRSVMELAGGKPPVGIPVPICKSIIALAFLGGRVSSRLNGASRRLEMLWIGQEQDAAWARSNGLEGPSHIKEFFQELAEEEK